MKNGSKFFENLNVCCLGKVVRRGGGLYASHTFQSLSTLIPIERKILCQMNTHYILLPSSRCFSSTELCYRLEHGANCSEGQLTGKTLTPFEAQGRLRNSREFIPLLVCLQLGPSFSWRVTHISIERLSWFVTVVIYGCESWTVKKAERQRIDAFELWCWRRLLRVPWTARRSNQSILKGISPGCSLEGLMLNLKLQYFGHLIWRVDLLEKTLILGAIGGRRRRGWQSLRWLHGITDGWVWVNSGSWWWTGRPGDSWGCKESDMTEWLNWIEWND